MLTHYLKIAFRNLTKYKMQSIISIVGLAVGFVCFALSALWIRYEMTFDNFHKNADRMYVIYTTEWISPSGIRRMASPPLAAHLRETFPEVEDAIAIVQGNRNQSVFVDEVSHQALVIRADTSIFRMFDIRIIQGNSDFLLPGSEQIAITQSKARQLFGDENPIGERIIFHGRNVTISAVVTDMPRRSNYAFDFIAPFEEVPPGTEWRQIASSGVVFKLYPGVNVDDFKQKLQEYDIRPKTGAPFGLTMKPLTQIRYIDPDIERDVRFQHIILFAISGLLVVLCSLFNYLTLFVSRFRIRQKEMALRKVCGATGHSLLAMLSVEFLLTLLFAVLLGGFLTHLAHNTFVSLSEIQMSLSEVYRELLVYIGGVILLLLLVFWLLVFILQRRSLSISIHRSNRKLSRKISVVVQLIISIGFTFCTVVILKQMHFLQNTHELGFSFQNRATITMGDAGLNGALAHQLTQIPEITKVVDAPGMFSLMPAGRQLTIGTHFWDNQPAEMSRTDMDIVWASPEYIDFWNLQLIAGELLTAASLDSLVLINESAARNFGWYDAVGKNFNAAGQNFTVKGVVRDVLNLSPTAQPRPAFFANPSVLSQWGVTGTTVLFQYREGSWGTVRERIGEIMEEEFRGEGFNLQNASEAYERLLTSENALMRLLFFVSLICILICIFGFVSLVSLTCEERRKQIAIRKISGATISNILNIFAKEYSLLLIIGAVIAFSGGYIIMQGWLEQYVKQTAIPVWVYLSIIFVMASVIVLCVGWRVWQTSRENPAEVLKSEC